MDTARSNKSDASGSRHMARLTYSGVDSGTHKTPDVDPMKEKLRYTYRRDAGSTTTSQEEYGLFIKALSRAVDDRKKLCEKQRIRKDIKGSF